MTCEDRKISVGLLTVSDRCFRQLTKDISGSCMRELVDGGSHLKAKVLVEECVPDELEAITTVLTNWCDSMKVNLIFTLGGTGFSPRDVTPEATKAVIEKEAPGLSLAMIKMSLEITPLAMLSRPVCGIRKKSLIVNLPGSPKAVKECFQIIAPSLQHAVDLITGSNDVAETHKRMQSSALPAIEHHHSCQNARPVDAGTVAFRPRHSTFPMISVEEAQHIVLNHCNVTAYEAIDYMSCVGRVLASDIFSRDPLPPFPASMKDGYAVIAADGLGVRQVIGASIAGSQLAEIKVHPGYCARISTGAPLPPGADSVIMVEETKLISATEDGQEELQIEIMAQVRRGQEIRATGCDIKEGDLVLERGTVLTPTDVGILATVGQTKVEVYALPIVAVLSTGNELQESKIDLQSGRIRDSNRPALLTFLKQQGFPTFDAGIAEDHPKALHQRITAAFEEADVLVSTGGVSMGEMDLLRHILVSRFNAVIHFGRVDMKPGKPTTFASCQYDGKTKLIFALPGNPVSAIVTCHLFVIPACKKMSDHEKHLPIRIKAELSNSTGLFHLDSRPEYHRVTLQWHSGKPVPSAISTGNQRSSRLQSMNRANGLAILPSKTPEILTIPNGTIVDVLVIDMF
ncbi:gephyrin-like [Daphnia carinata]|uniref:gephyrin-like n=1 Tax=Daphnia carinata TaxID=120202 RepID=UPI00257F7975|nr:gephyrin-like [Daphnia carinata]